MSRRPKPIPMGPLSANSSHMPHLLGEHSFSDYVPTRVCNASMAQAAPGEITRLMTAAVRPGALAFMECRSVGTRC